MTSIKKVLSTALSKTEDTGSALLWRHNGRDGVSNHQPHDCLLNHIFRPRSKKTSKLRVTGLCAGNSPMTGEFPHKGPVTRHHVNNMYDVNPPSTHWGLNIIPALFQTTSFNAFSWLKMRLKFLRNQWKLSIHQSGSGNKLVPNWHLAITNYEAVHWSTYTPHWVNMAVFGREFTYCLHIDMNPVLLSVNIDNFHGDVFLKHTVRATVVIHCIQNAGLLFHLKKEFYIESFMNHNMLSESPLRITKYIWSFVSPEIKFVPYWGANNVVDILQMAFWNIFSSTKIFPNIPLKVLLKFLGVWFTNSRHWFG